MALPDFHECAVSCGIFSFDILRCENVTHYSGNAGGPVARLLLSSPYQSVVVERVALLLCIQEA
jgi:hypothetical protein